MPQYVMDQPTVAAGAIGQFKAVELTARQTVQQCDATNDLAYGICQEEVSAADAVNGRVIGVRVEGVSRCIAGAAIAVGASVRVTGTVGKLQTCAATTAKQNQVGIAQTAAAADGDHFDVLLTPGAQIDT